MRNFRIPVSGARRFSLKTSHAKSEKDDKRPAGRGRIEMVDHRDDRRPPRKTKKNR